MIEFCRGFGAPLEILVKASAGSYFCHSGKQRSLIERKLFDIAVTVFAAAHYHMVAIGCKRHRSYHRKKKENGEPDKESFSFFADFKT